MSSYIDFLTNHWALSGGLLIVTLLILVYESGFRIWGLRRISPSTTVQLMNHEGARILDIRSKAEYDHGHIIHSIHLNPTHIQEYIHQHSQDKPKPIILVGASDMMMVQIAKNLLKNGFQSVQILSGGISSWENEGLPLIQ